MSVTIDYDGATRDASTPDMGADEFTPPACVTAVGGTATGSASFCGSGTPTITATGYSTGSNSSYQWISSTNAGDYPNAGAPVNGQTNPATLTTGVVNTTTYYWLRVTCGTNTSTDNSTLVTITINPSAASISGPTSKCANDPAVSLTENGGTGTSWVWSTTATTQSISVNPASTTTYTVTVTSPGSCTATATKTVTVNPVPTVTGVTALPNPLCAGNTLNLTSTGATAVSGYSIASVPFSPITSGAGTTTLCNAGSATTTLTSGSLDDGYWNGITLPFSFTYFGTAYNSINVQTNGIVSFSAFSRTTGYNNSPQMPNTSLPLNIAGVFGDMYWTSGGKISTYTSGSAPNRIFVIDYNGTGTPSIGGFFNSGFTPTSIVNFQVQLFENGNKIQIHTTNITSDASHNHTMGVENADGTAANVVTGRNNSLWSLSNDGTQFTPVSITYAWSGPNSYTSTAQNPSITNIPVAGSGVYTVVVTDINGCTATAATPSVTVNSTTAAITNNTGTTELNCNNTSISVTATGGSTYVWNGGLGSSPNAIISSAGTYTVTVTDNSCTATASITITGNTTPPSAGISAGTMELNCTTTSIDLTATGGGAYLWDDNTTTTALRTVSSAGTYTVIVTGANGCTASATKAITSNTTPPSAGINAGTTVLTCATTSIDLTATGSGTYTWDDNSGNAQRSVNAAGTYTVTVTGANGCTASATIVIHSNYGEPGAVITNETGTSELTCTTTSIRASVSGNGTISGWENNSTDNPRIFTAAGTYTVVVTAPNGCTSSATIVITSNTTPPSAGINAGTTVLTCTTTSIELTATGSGTYAWDNSSTDAARTVNAAGTYTVTVTGANGCTSTATIAITSNTTSPGANISSATTELTCSTTSIDLTASGNGTYAWDNSTTNALRTVNSAGTYTVVVTGANGCTSSASIAITSNTTPPSAGINAGTTVLTCSTTSIDLTASGNGTYAWDGNSTNAMRTVSATGTYTVTVTGANGCTSSATIAITSNTTAPGAAINTGSTELTCTTTSIDLTATGGGTYAWDDNSANAMRTVSATGTYTVTVTGANGCTATATIDITSNTTPPSAGITNNTGTSVLTCSTTSISLTATGSGTYHWDNNSSNASRSVSAAGTYTVTVTGANGCTSTATIAITSNTTPPSAGITNNTGSSVLTCVTTSISLTATGNGSYNWDNSSSNASRSVSAAGTYTVTVTGANGCTATATIDITSNTTPPSAGITNNTGSTVLTCNTTSISLTATGNGSYNWDNSSSNASRSVSAAGTYTVTVTGGNGCTATATIAITSNTTPPSAGITNNTGSTVLTCSTTSISLTATGNGSYNWDNSSSNASRSVSAAGTYTVTVTGANGCTATATIAITSNTTPPSAGITNNTGSSVLTCSTTSISLTATGNGSYNWDNSSSNASRSVSAAGTYTVTVTGANGCTSTATIAITSNTTPPSAGITNNTGTTVLTCVTTSISLTATGNGSYNWDNSSSNASRSISAAGTYTVTVTGANGCMATATIAITSNTTPPSAGITNNTGTTVLTCVTTSISLTATGNGSYNWDNNSSNASRSVSAAGTYTVTVTGANGCTASATIAITQNPAIVVTATPGTILCNGGTTTVNVSALGGSGTYSSGTGAFTRSAGNFTFTVTDNNGCTGSTSIVINQPAPLVVTASNVIGYVGGAPVALIGSPTTGGSGVFSQANPFPPTANPSTTNYTYTFTNTNGCMATSSPATITILPAPTIVCPANITVACGASVCGAVVTVPQPVVGDACAQSSLQNSYTHTNNASGTYPVATTTVSWSAVDCNANPVNCSMTVKVIDNRIPNITCPANQTRVGNPAAVVLPAPSGMTDNCGISHWDARYKVGTVWSSWVTATNPTTGPSPIDGSYSPGSYTVQYEDFDISGNLKICQFNLTVTASLIAAPNGSTTTDATGFGKEDESGRLPESSENQPSLQCYPNPFTDEVNIAFSLVSGADVRLSITDLTGHEIGLLANNWLRKGDYNFELPSENLSAGVYFVRLQVGQKRVIAKVVKL